MLPFSRLLSERWNIPRDLAEKICVSYEKGESPWYLCDYCPEFCAEVDVMQLWEMFDFLKEAAELAPRKKRALTIITKGDALSDEVRQRIELTLDPHELEDMVIACRPNPRSRAQVALKRGLGPLADSILAQEEESGDLEQKAKEYLGKDPALKAVEDVLAGVKDILAERFAYDETVRAMAREFCREDGFYQITPRNGKDPRYAKVKDTALVLSEIAEEDFLAYCLAEEKKEIRFKLGVQLFRITEVLRHHFVENPDAIGFDLICDAINESWQRLLFPIVERDVKQSVRAEYQSRMLKRITHDVTARFASTVGASSDKGVVSVVADEQGRLVCAAVAADGRLLSASVEKKPLDKVAAPSERLRKLVVRYAPGTVVVPGGEVAHVLREAVAQSCEAEQSGTRIIVLESAALRMKMAQSEWMKRTCSDLEPAMRLAYALALSYLEPLSLIGQIGPRYFSLHPRQELVPEEKLLELISRIIIQDGLRKGIRVRDLCDSVLAAVPGVSEQMLAAIRARGMSHPFESKKDIRSVKGMSDVLYHTIAGYVVLPESSNPLDATLVHPQQYELVEGLCRDIGVPVEAVINGPGLLTGASIDDFALQLYVQRNLCGQLEAGVRYLSSSPSQPRRKLRLDELSEGTVLQGRVTNITPFGVFVNINAVCDGLIHISQLADTYVESPDQVVSVGDPVYVRVVKIDPAKRRISLSMKDLGAKAPKVKPTTNQLDTLVSHFSSR